MTGNAGSIQPVPWMPSRVDSRCAKERGNMKITGIEVIPFNVHSTDLLKQRSLRPRKCSRLSTKFGTLERAEEYFFGGSLPWRPGSPFASRTGIRRAAWYGPSSQVPVR